MAYFKYIQRLDIPANELLNFLRDEIDSLVEYPYDEVNGETPVPCAWSVHSEITEGDKVQTLILKRGIPEGEVAKEFYVKFENEAVINPSTGYATINVQLLEGFDSETGDFKYKGPVVRYQFADESMANTERTANHSVHVYMNIDNDRIAAVLQADPVVNFNDYRKSFIYVGKTVPFEFNQDDIDGNVLLTAGAVKDEPTPEELRTRDEYFGVYTSPGNNTFQMLATKSGVKFQKHYPAFITPAPKPGDAYIHEKLGDTGLELEKHGFQASRYTDKYHLSPIYVVHPYEGYRSQLKDCIAVLKHNILHYDKLIVDVDKQRYPEKPWRQEVYRYFDINTEQNFFNMSPNRGTAVAILSELRY